MESRFNSPSRRYDFTGKILIRHLDRIVLSNNKVVGYISHIENILQEAINGIKYIENIYNFAKDKDKLID